MATRVRDKCMQNGLLVLGLTGIIDGQEGDSITLAPVSSADGSKHQNRR
jgi:hypothetical protein